MWTQMAQCRAFSHQYIVINSSTKAIAQFFGLNFSNLKYFSYFAFRHFHAFRKFFGQRFTTLFLHNLPGDTIEFVDGFDHVHRNTYRARLIRY